MSLAILGLGTAVPPSVLNQDQAAAITRNICCRTPEQHAWLPALYGQTGIERRHMAFERPILDDMINGTTTTASDFLPKAEDDHLGPTTGRRMRHYLEQAPPLALEAARQALTESGIAPGDCTHLVTVSCTGFVAPGVDFELITGLELSPSIERSHIGFMGCHAALNGLRVANAFLGADPAARVLLCAVELCGLHFHYGWDPQKLIANALFADGAAAVVGVPQTVAPADAWCVAATGSQLIPNSKQAMSWTVGDHGFEMTLSKRVPGLIARHVRPWLDSWLGSHGLDVARVGTWAVHPGGPRILDAVDDALGLPTGSAVVSRAVFADHGNMSSPTILFIIDRLRKANAPRPCVALGFGPGLVAEAVLFR